VKNSAALIAWRIGAALQGIALGVLLTLAILELVQLASGAQVFRYQGF